MADNKNHRQMLEINQNIVAESRVEYGDFQTNKQLAETICNYLHNEDINPPWVTNSQLSALNSNNLPAKSNFKQAKGIDAITGKQNSRL